MGLIGVGSSRDSEARGFLIGGNSVVLMDGVVAAESERVGYVGDLGAGGLSTSNAVRFSSTGGTAMVGSVIERLGAVRPVITGETLSFVTLTVGSEMTVGVGLGRAKPWVRFDSLSLMLVGERVSFLKLAAAATDRTTGDGLAETVGELFRDLISIRGFGGKLRPEPLDIALPGLRG